MYSISVSLCAGLLSFLILLVLWLRTVDGEQAGWYGVTWIFFLPWILVAGLLGGLSYAWYRRQTTWLGVMSVFLSTVIIATTVGGVAGYLFVRINA